MFLTSTVDHGGSMDNKNGKDPRRKITRDDSGIFSPSPITPQRHELSLPTHAGTSGLRGPVTETGGVMTATETHKVTPRPLLARHHSFTEVSPTTLSPLGDDPLTIAFSCRDIKGHQDWNHCPHANCQNIRQQWEHLRNCSLSIPASRSCSVCAEFQKLVLNHASKCPGENCVVVLCLDAKTQLEQYASTAMNRNRMVRSSSDNDFQSLPSSINATRPRASSTSEHYARQNHSSFFAALNAFTRMGIRDLPPKLSRSVTTRAEEIVTQLEQEESFEESPYQTPESSLHRPMTLTQSAMVGNIPIVSSIKTQDREFQLSSASMMLSPIAEQPGSEQQTPSPKEEIPSLIPRGFAPPASVEEFAVRRYPMQQVLERFDKEFVTMGEDNCYFEQRDYFLNDIQPLGEGGFGTCVPGQDLTTRMVFAMKRNNRSDQDKIDSIQSECAVLARLGGHHDNVIRFLGAVIDEDLEQHPPRICKMMMELAENGNLHEMLQDDGESAPLPVDQSLYYLQQILQGVHFLHENGVLHLDIKAMNVLVFDNGRMVKLADFGSAVHIGDIPTMGIAKVKGCSPHFAAPEVIRQEQPTFSADIWSVMCVFVEMLTAKLPGCYHFMRDQTSMMFLIGNFTDDQVENVVPITDLKLDPEVAELFKITFKSEPSQRPTALDLLNHPKIMFAYEYEKCFDDIDFEEELDEDESFETAPTSLPEVGATPLDSTEREMLKKRCSSDSGTGSMVGVSPLGRSSIGSRMSDSGLDTPGSADVWNRHFYFRTRSLQQQESIKEDREEMPDRSAEPSRKNRTQSLSWQADYGFNGEFHSLPPISNELEDIFGSRIRSSSFGSKPPRPRPISIQPLIHSNSAPVIESHHRRRKSLGMASSGSDTETDGGVGLKRSYLRRTSSEVYVEKGPDIDTPPEKKHPTELVDPTSDGSRESSLTSHSLTSSSSSDHSAYVSAATSMTATTSSSSSVMASLQSVATSDASLESTADVSGAHGPDAVRHDETDKKSGGDNGSKVFQHII